MRNTAVFT